jgi:hypothetical protein
LVGAEWRKLRVDLGQRNSSFSIVCERGGSQDSNWARRQWTPHSSASEFFVIFFFFFSCLINCSGGWLVESFCFSPFAQIPVLSSFFAFFFHQGEEDIEAGFNLVG